MSNDTFTRGFLARVAVAVVVAVALMVTVAPDGVLGGVLAALVGFVVAQGIDRAVPREGGSQ